MKKRVMGWLLALVMAATLLPVQALAAELEQPDELRWMVTYRDPVTGEIVTYEDDMEEVAAKPADDGGISLYAEDDGYRYNDSLPRYGYNMLAQMEKGSALTALYRGLLAAAKRYDGTGEYDSRMDGIKGEYVWTDDLDEDITQDDAWLVICTMRNDHPELFWVKSAYGCSLGWGQSDVCSAVYLFYYTYDTTIQAAKADVMSVTDKFLSAAPQSGSDYEKEKYFHDALAAHITYNINEMDQGAYTAMVKGEGVCAGYATAFQYLLQCAGIESFVVTGWGKGGCHAWNTVKLGDDWYFVDLTWDDQSRVIYTYFNRGTAFMEKTHEIDESSNVSIGTLYDYDPNKVTTRYEDQDDTYHKIIKSDGTKLLEEHLYNDDWTVIDQVSCMVDGTRRRSCVKCGHVQEERIAAPGQHTSIFWDACGDYEVQYGCRACGVTWKDSRFKYTQQDESVTIGGFLGDLENIVIPCQLNGLPVTAIETDNDDPFCSNTVLKTVALLDTVLTLGASAFENCAALEAILIPASVTAIGNDAFAHCTGLQDVYFNGTPSQWNKITIGSGNDCLTGATIHYIQSGDLNGSGSAADASDVQCLYTYLTGGGIDGALAQRETFFKAVADVNGDGNVDVYDLQRLYETVSGVVPAA